MTPAQAAQLECRKVPPITNDDPLDGTLWHKCSGPSCMSWRWLALKADAAYMAAIAKAEKTKSLTHAAAAKYVVENRAEFGLPTAPTHGYCGRDGKPEVG